MLIETLKEIDRDDATCDVASGECESCRERLISVLDYDQERGRVRPLVFTNLFVNDEFDVLICRCSQLRSNTSREVRPNCE
jgi:hypothetical protein